MNKNKKQILVVCRGNILRSSFAEVIIKRRIYKENLQDRFSVISRGTQGTEIDPIPVKFKNVTFYKDIFPLAKKSLNKYSIDLSHHISKSVKKEDALNSSIIFAMDNKTYKALQRLFPRYVSKIYKFSAITNNEEINFDDPEKMNTEQEYEAIFDKIHKTVQTGFSKLITLAKIEKKL